MVKDIADLKDAIVSRVSSLMIQSDRIKNDYHINVDLIDTEEDFNKIKVTDEYRKKFFSQLPGKKVKWEGKDVTVSNIYHGKQIAVRASSKKETFVYRIRVIFSYATNTWYAIPFGLNSLDDGTWKKEMNNFKKDFEDSLDCYNVKMIDSKKEWNEKVMEETKVCVFRQNLDW